MPLARAAGHWTSAVGAARGMRTGLAALAAACACVLAGGAGPAQAAPHLPPGFEQTNAAAFGTAAGTITDAAYTPDGRLLATEKDGRLWVKSGTAAPQVVLDISDHVNSYRDRGLNGLAVDKDFAENHWVYLVYVYEHVPGDPTGRKVSRLTRITLNDDNTAADPAGPQGPETTILGKSASIPCPQSSNTDDCIPADYTWHTIGTVRSDPADGTLWLGTGDATYSYVVDQQTFGTRDDHTYRGKILHVDRDGNGVPGHPFCPTDNDLTHVCTKIYAEGFRNPFRFYLRPGKGPVAGDVGQDTHEEVDLVKPGGNYGWPCYEGEARGVNYQDTPECQALYAKEGTAQAAIPPVYDYLHNSAGGSALGGPVYAGSGYPSSYMGDVFVADYAQGWVRRLDLNAAGDAVTDVHDFATYDPGTVPTFVDVIEMPGTKNVGFVDIGWGNDPWVGGFVSEFRYSPANASPVARATGTPLAGSAPLRVSFDASASTDANGDTLSFAWNFGDGSTGSGAKPAHTYSTPASYTATVTVTDGRGGSATATVGPITPGNTAPVPAITAPTDRATFRYGSTVALSGGATDAQDGTIPSSRLRWTIHQQHGGHKHDFQGITGSTGSFAPGNDHDADSYFEITLTATDAQGLTGSKTIRLDPETIDFTLAGVPSGAPLGYGTAAVTAPSTRQSGIGFFTQISAAASFVKDGTAYTFDDWSDGGAALHNVTIPATDTTLTATYNGRPSASGTATPAGTEAPAVVAFDGRGSSDPDGDALTYDWDFGDGTTHGTGAQPAHTYAAPGSYSPRLTVSDGRPGGTHSVTLAAITITGPAPAPSPIAPALEPVPAPVAPGQPVEPQPKRPPRLGLPSRGLRLSSKGQVSFKLANPEPTVWRGQVVLATSGKVRVAGRKARRVTFAHGTLFVARKAKRVVRLQLSPANRRLVARLRRVRVTVTLTPQDGKPLRPAASVLLPPRH